MSNDANAAASSQSEQARDDLALIEGIGQGYAQALEKIGVRRFADLARYTPQNLAQALRTQAAVTVTAKRIAAEDWIGQASRLAQPTQAARVSTAETVGVGSPHEIVIRRGDMMNEITLQRGGRAVTFKKLPDRFAVRLKQGRATSETALMAALGAPETDVNHVDDIPPENMDLFVIKDTTKMETTVDALRQAPTADVVSHVYALDDTPGGEIIPTGSLTIQFKPMVSKSQREAILAEFGLAVVTELHFLPDGYTVRLTAASVENPLKIAAKLQQRPEIMVAEPDVSVRAALQYVPVDDLYPQQWHLKNRGDQLGLLPGADVKAEEAWDQTRGSRAITICIIDDGFDLGHHDLNHPDKIVVPRDFGQNDFDPNPDFVGDNHGTACAGVALAEENGQGVVGLAPGCAFMPVRMSAWLTDDAVVSYFQYAVDHGADVISCSWQARPWYFPLSTKMDAIIHFAATKGRRNQQGCVILFAAGNDDRPLDGQKDGQPSLQGFALHADVIAVAASNSLDQRASYSNFGPELALCAPSSGSPGRGIVTTDRRGLNGYTTGDYTFSFGGTSSATPLAAGLAALILSVNPQLASTEVKRIMMETADKIDAAHGEYVAEHSPWYGHGRINADQAVRRARQTIGETSGADEERASNIGLAIADVQLTVVGPAPGSAMRRLQVATHFQLTGSDATVVTTQHLPWQIEVETIEAFSGAPSLVATAQGQLQPQVFDYTSPLLFPIPVPGRYTLKSNVRLIPPAGEKSAVYEGPPLRVLG